MTVPLREKLKDQGWYLSDHGYDLVTDSGNILDIQKIIKRAVDFDLREIGCGQGDAAQGNIVLQIQKIRNVAAPKNNEESRAAPRMLKLSLTDGKNNLQALEVEHIPTISLNTPPGTKILIRPGNNLLLSHGIVLLRPLHIAQVLGGRVANLVEKWELNKKLASHSRVRSAEEGGPPPWIPFGKKIIKVSEQDKNFKALAEKDKSSKENAEFEAQRKDAIAEAAKQGCKKVFGGGNKQLLDHSVQKIVDHGFTIEQAEHALRISRNNVDKALKSLQRSENRQREPREPREPRESRGKKFDKKTEESKPSSGKISLFDFLEDKLPIQPESVETNNLLHNSGTYNSDNHFDHFESKNSNAQSSRGGRAQRSGRGYQVPPRHSEDNRSNKRVNNSSTVASQFSQYNGSSSSQQNKPPRFQRNQDTHNYQQNNTTKGSYQRSSQSNDGRNSFTNVGDGGAGNYHKNQQDLSGKNSSSSKNYNHLDTGDARNRQCYDASYSRHNRTQQDGTTRAHSANTTDKNYKNQLNKYQTSSSSDHNGSRSVTAQKNENHYGNNQNSHTFGSGQYVWRIGDKCLAKYWEDNRYYNAVVTGVSDRTCVVLFKGFENFEEVLQVDCLPITEDDEGIPDYAFESRRQDSRFTNKPHYNQNHNHVSETGFTSGMEFRRGGNGTGSGNKSYRKRGQQRSSQPIYQPPAQRNHNTVTTNTQNNTQN